jgi:hypothetical protein
MPLSRADAFVVLQECSEIREEKRTGPKPVILGECFVVSSALLDRMIQLLDDFYNTYVTNKTIQTSLPKLETSEQQTNTSEVNKNTNADQFSSNESHSNDKITEREEIREAEETSSHYERSIDYCFVFVDFIEGVHFLTLSQSTQIKLSFHVQKVADDERKKTTVLRKGAFRNNLLHV